MAKKTKKIIKPNRVMVCFKCCKCPEKLEVQMSHLVTLNISCPRCNVYNDNYMGITGIYIKEK